MPVCQAKELILELIDQTKSGEPDRESPWEDGHGGETCCDESPVKFSMAFWFQPKNS